MSRRHEANHVVYSGWMVKSPPEKKLTGPWRIFRAKWKRRYFVLSKPATSLPGTYLLNYFSDENCRRQRGTIDLEQCAEIIESLDSDQFQYLLAIKTTHKGRERTYFLATETEEQMTTWVRNLCTVCGMKPDESDVPEAPSSRYEQPPPRRTQPTPTFPAAAQGVMERPNPALLETPVSASSHTSPRTASPAQPARRTTLPQHQHKPAPSPALQGEEYIPLETCTSGSKRAERQVSVDSMPDEKAPPIPPLKGMAEVPDDSVFDHSQTYDVPPPMAGGGDEEEDVYKVPPPRPPERDPPNQELYDVPPAPGSNNRYSSGSDNQLVDTAGMLYDTPPTRPLVEDDVYDVPPSHGSVPSSHNNTMDEDMLAMVPPVRPPKPSSLQEPSLAPGQDTYMNIPTNSKAYGDKSNKVDINSIVQLPSQGLAHTDLYDTPRSNPTECAITPHAKRSESKEKLSATVPPPPSMCVPSEVRYVNNLGPAEPEQDVYLAMDKLGTTSPGSPAQLPRKSSSTDNEVEYTDMSGKSSFDESSEGRTIYDHPPPSRPTDPPPRPAKTLASETAQDTYSIFSSSRTRSFKKKAEGSPLIKKKSPLVNNNPAPVVTQTNVPLPQRVDQHPDFSTSDEDDEEMGNTQDVWGTTPPAPSTKDSELKYVDLDHDETTHVRSPHTTAHKPLTVTEYHDIDFVKTDALRNVKETVSVERSKHNT